MAKPDDASNPALIDPRPNGTLASPIPGILYALHGTNSRAMDDACHLLTITGAIPATPRLRYERYWIGPALTATEDDYREFMAFRCLLELYELEATAMLGAITAIVLPM